jgi:hypothetical protein
VATLEQVAARAVELPEFADDFGRMVLLSQLQGAKIMNDSKAKELGREVASAITKGGDTTKKPLGIPLVPLLNACTQADVDELTAGDFIRIKEAMDEALDEAARWGSA